MAADIQIKTSFRARRVYGWVVVAFGAVLTLFLGNIGLILASRMDALLVFSPGPIILLAGLWLAFPTRRPVVYMVITDNDIQIMPRGIPTKPTIIALEDLRSITLAFPVLTKFPRLTFATEKDTVKFEMFHLTHTAQEIINLIGMRLEMRGSHLKEGESPVLGAKNGIWTVHDGVPF